MVERFYNALLILTSPVWGLWLLWRLIGQRKDRRAFGQRWWGLGPDALPADAAARTPRIWIHAVSVGEVMAVAPLATALRREHPRALLIGSTVTDLGQETMKAKLPELDAVCYLPFDLGWSVRRTLESIRPTLFLFAETELWPNLLLALSRRGVPAVMVNGRVSERSVRRYGWIGPFIRRVVRSVEALTVQRDTDRQRCIRLGADPARVTVCGNLKADGATAPTVDAGALKRAMGLGGLGPERLVIIGSTHDPEERLAAHAFLDLVAHDPGLRLCIAPRHLNRCDQIEAILRGMGVTPVRRSRLPASGRAWTKPREVVLLDTMGELAAGYELASVVIMGGTFAPIGGHNLLEPAAAGRPILFGPHIGQWKAIAEELAAAGGAIGLGEASELGGALRRVLADGGAQQRMGEAARAYVRSQQGATNRTMTVITRVLERGQRAKASRQSYPAAAGSGTSRTANRWSMLSRWLWQSGPLGSTVKWLLAPIAWGYGLAASIRRWGYHRGLFPAARLPVQVISVGNLTVGGSGKTPVVMALAQLMASTGRQVGVVTRGYRGVRPGDPWLVSDGRTVQATVEEAGDEAILLARRLEGIPVAVGRDRAAAGRLLLALNLPGLPKTDVVIMDDGFQHLSLHRDLNLLVIDGGRPGLDQRLLPCGPLRESWSAVRDASAVVVIDRAGTMTPVDEERRRLRDRLRGRGFDGPLFLARMRPSGLVAVPSGDPLPVTALAGAEVAICSGIGYPESFRDTMAQAGAHIVGEWVYDDHHGYTSKEVTAMIREARRLGATMLLTTEKDAVKLTARPFMSDGDLPIVAVRMAVVIEPGSEWRQWLARYRMVSEPASPSSGYITRAESDQPAAARGVGASEDVMPIPHGPPHKMTGTGSTII
jgi:tetraacyldisaccharide 4'-kinase